MRNFGSTIRVYNICLLIFKRHIHRDSLWECMKEFKIPTKLINICKICVQETRGVVRIEGTLSSFFEDKTGVKQGDSLSPILFNLSLQKVIQSIKIVPSGIKIDKEQLDVLAYAGDIALIGKNETNKKTFCRNGKHCQKVRTIDKPRKDKICDSGKEKQFKEK